MTNSISRLVVGNRYKTVPTIKPESDNHRKKARTLGSSMQSPLLIICLLVLLLAKSSITIRLSYRIIMWHGKTCLPCNPYGKYRDHSGILLNLMDQENTSRKLVILSIILKKSVGSRFLAQALDSTALQKNTRLTYG